MDLGRRLSFPLRKVPFMRKKIKFDSPTLNRKWEVYAFYSRLTAQGAVKGRESSVNLKYVNDHGEEVPVVCKSTEMEPNKPLEIKSSRGNVLFKVTYCP
jgi:hypothetical protein